MKAVHLGHRQITNCMHEENSALKAAGLPFFFRTKVHGETKPADKGKDVRTLACCLSTLVKPPDGTTHKTAQDDERWADLTKRNRTIAKNTVWRREQLAEQKMMHQLQIDKVRQVVRAAAFPVNQISVLATEFAGYHIRRILNDPVSDVPTCNQRFWRVVFKLISVPRGKSIPTIYKSKTQKALPQNQVEALNESAESFWKLKNDAYPTDAMFPWPSREYLGNLFDAVAVQLQTSAGNILNHNLFAQQRKTVKFQLQAVSKDLTQKAVVDKTIAMICLGVPFDEAIAGEEASFPMKAHEQAVGQIVEQHQQWFPPITKDFKLDSSKVEKQHLWKNYSWMLRYYHALWLMRKESWELVQEQETKDRADRPLKNGTNACRDSEKRGWSRDKDGKQSRKFPPFLSAAQPPMSAGQQQQQKKKKQKQLKTFQLLPMIT